MKLEYRWAILLFLFRIDSHALLFTVILPQTKLEGLVKAAGERKKRISDNNAFLQFNWKADVVESWIGKICSWQIPRASAFHEVFLATSNASAGSRKVATNSMACQCSDEK